MREDKQGVNDSELRKDPFTGRWIFIAPSRSGRPTDFPLYQQTGAGTVQCPFCEGFEHLTPPEIKAIREPESLPDSSGWKVRVVPNLYPVIGEPAQLDSLESAVDERAGLFISRKPVGYHEIIIETPEHDSVLSDLDGPDLLRVLEVYSERLSTLGSKSSVAHVLLFRNRGERSGASLSHPHAQILASPVIPRPVQEKINSSLVHFRDKGECLLCDIVREERSWADRIVYDSGEFLTFAPFASRFPFEVWIVPASHQSRFDSSSRSVLRALADHLRIVLPMFDRCLGNPSSNMVFFSAPSPVDPDLNKAFHWHIELLPRLSRASGYEWGNGYFVNSVSPEEAARRLKSEG